MDSLPESTVTAFRHDALPNATNHMRFLEILDDNYSDTIKVRCRITTWQSDSLPSYHAISYTWGDPKSKTTILLNDKPCQVGTNCEFVLKQALRHANSQYYWVDAICIDQEDLNEKSKQVAMMGNIYKRADHVLACVGDHTEESLFLFENFDRFRHSFRESGLDGEALILRLYWKFGFSTTQRFIHACMNFPERPYFSRLWVIQELKNARRTSILCGQGAVPRDDLLHMCECFAKGQLWRKLKKPTWRPISFVLGRNAIKGQRSRENEQPGPKSSLRILAKMLVFRKLLADNVDLLDLLFLTTQLQCTIPQDKVYGIISMLETGDHGPIVPDYTKTQFEVALDLLHAIWHTDFVQKQDSVPGLIRACTLTIYNLDLDGASPSGIFGGLMARNFSNSPPEGAFKETGMRPEDSLAPSLATGWRVSVDDLIQGDDPRCKSWNPPDFKKIKVFIPYWIREGDWIVHIEGYWEMPRMFLVLRQEAEDSVMRIVGHGYSASSGSPDLIGSAFKIFWDPEDILVFTYLQSIARNA